MEVINHTPFPHLLFKSGMMDNKMAAAVILKVTYDVSGGHATVAAEQAWQLFPAPWQSEEYGAMEGDLIFKRGGVDLMVFGAAKTPGGVPMQRMDVQVKLANKINKTIRVTGNRFWETGFWGLRMTDPEYFTELPLSLNNAFGGWDEWDGLKFPYSNNPHGKGFIWLKENANGKPLPNVESKESLISKWDSRPFPAGVGSLPMNEIRAKKAVQFDDNGNMIHFDPLFYNAAFPDMIAPEVLPGEIVTVEGMTANQPFKFVVPEQKINVRLSFAEKEYIRPTYIDQIGLEPNKNRAFITYRYAFNYEIVKHTKRLLEIMQ